MKSTEIPLCPVHQVKMVTDPADPSRTKKSDPLDNPKRHPKTKRIWTQSDKAILEEKMSKIIPMLDSIPIESSIALIANTEDEDLKHYVMLLLLDQGRNKIQISEPDPRHLWVNKLDSDWTDKFGKALKDCDVALYICRPNTKPNQATAWELETLKNYNKEVFVCELDFKL
ncbi:MAG: hypothetical protein HXX16_18795 [Bacteroidales bacterium]|nr:hypothetical protein [Bacteroidales bacterium]